MIFDLLTLRYLKEIMMTLEELTEYIMRRAFALGILQQGRGVIYLDVPGGCGKTILFSRILKICGYGEELPSTLRHHHGILNRGGRYQPTKYLTGYIFKCEEYQARGAAHSHYLIWIK